MENDSNVFHVINNLTFNNSANIGNGVRKLFRSLLNFNLYILVMIRLIFLTKFLSKSILIFVQLINVSKFVLFLPIDTHHEEKSATIDSNNSSSVQSLSINFHPSFYSIVLNIQSKPKPFAA